MSNEAAKKEEQKMKRESQAPLNLSPIPFTLLNTSFLLFHIQSVGNKRFWFNFDYKSSTDVKPKKAGKSWVLFFIVRKLEETPLTFLRSIRCSSFSLQQILFILISSFVYCFPKLLACCLQIFMLEFCKWCKKLSSFWFGQNSSSHLKVCHCKFLLSI